MSGWFEDLGNNIQRLAPGNGAWTGHSDLYKDENRVKYVLGELERIGSKEVDAAHDDAKAAIAKINKALANTPYTLPEDSLTDVYDWIRTLIQDIYNKVEYNAGQADEYSESLKDPKAWLSTYLMLKGKVVEGFFGAGEQIVDGFASFAGRLVGKDSETQKRISDFIEKDHVGDFMDKWYYDKLDITDNSLITSDSLFSQGAKLVGGTVGYIAIGAAVEAAVAAAAPAAAAAGAATAVGTTTSIVARVLPAHLARSMGIAFIGGTGGGTEAALKSGLDFEAATNQGFKIGAIQAAFVFGTYHTANFIRSLFNKKAAVGDGTTSDGDGTTSDGDGTKTQGDGTKSQGDGTKTQGDGTKTQGDGTKSQGDGTKTQGDGTKSQGDGTKSQGDGTKTQGDGSSNGGNPSANPNNSPYADPDIVSNEIDDILTKFRNGEISSEEALTKLNNLKREVTSATGSTTGINKLVKNKYQKAAVEVTSTKPTSSPTPDTTAGEAKAPTATEAKTPTSTETSATTSSETKAIVKVETPAETSATTPAETKAIVKVEPQTESIVKVEPQTKSIVKVEPQTKSIVKVEPQPKAIVKVEPGGPLATIPEAAATAAPTSKIIDVIVPVNPNPKPIIKDPPKITVDIPEPTPPSPTSPETPTPVTPETPTPVTPETPTPVNPGTPTPVTPVTPTPVTPVTPTPVTPVTPEPVTPVTPEPVTPEPVTPEPVTPVTPEPVTPVTPDSEYAPIPNTGINNTSTTSFADYIKPAAVGAALGVGLGLAGKKKSKEDDEEEDLI